MYTRWRFHTEDAQILDAAVQNVVAGRPAPQDVCTLVIVHIHTQKVNETNIVLRPIFDFIQ